MHQDAQWCAAFVRYLRDGYQADLLDGRGETDAVKLATKLQITARGFFDFWADLTGRLGGTYSTSLYMVIQKWRGGDIEMCRNLAVSSYL